MSGLVAEYFERLSRKDGPVLTDVTGPQPRSVTGAELIDVLDRMAAELNSRGIGTGVRVLAFFDNTLEAALLLLTALRHGITLCLQPAGIGQADLDRVEKVAKCAGRINVSGRVDHGVLPLRMEQLPADVMRPSDLAPLTPFTITFTSGSTGEPKGVVHAAESFLSCAAAFNHQSGITYSDRFLNVMPMYYMAGIFNGILAPLQAGASIVIGAAFGTATAMRFWSLVRENSITAVWLSPTMLSLVVRLDRTDKTVPANFRRLFVGTGAMTQADAEAFFRIYGLPPLQSYGLSELLYISVDDPVAPAFGSVGCLLDGVNVSIDEIGRLAIASPYAFLGYLTDAGIQPTTAVFVTSDLAEMMGGHLFILGRSDDIILRGGVNINPVELETLLRGTVADRQFCISSVPDQTLGERVLLVLEGAPRTDDGDLQGAAQSLVRDRGVRASIDSIVYIPALPLGPTGKIRRSALKAALLADGR